jgi:hypothetical protein
MIEIIHGKACVKLNGRYYAVDTKQLDRAARIANNTGSTGCAYERVQRSARHNGNKHVFAR